MYTQSSMLSTKPLFRFIIFMFVNFLTDTSCDDAFQLDSSCYKVHKNEKVTWFTAVNRCRSNNASLAVFDDNVREYFPSYVLSERAWIGLVKSWWTWPSLGQLIMININFINNCH